MTLLALLIPTNMRFGSVILLSTSAEAFQVEEGLAEGGRLDVRGFVHQAQPNSRGVGIIQPFRSH